MKEDKKIHKIKSNQSNPETRYDDNENGGDDFSRIT